MKTTEVNQGRSTTGQPGVSVVICCHNGAKRLARTLAHLKRQQPGVSVAWEVVLVDNASVDETALVARASWGEDGLAPLRVGSASRN